MTGSALRTRPLAGLLFVSVAALAQEPATESSPDAAPAAPAPASLATAPTAAETPPPVTDSDDSPRVLEEFVVTAQKTRQPMRSVPISVSAISGEQVREGAITEVQELVQYTPNIRFQSGANNLPSISIRGFGSPPLGRNLEPSVGLSIDDVFYGRSTFANDAVFDIERLEVLRGPQGTLFGKNTIAGVLNFTTGEPALDPQGYATLALGSLDERRAEGGIGFPILEDRVAMRVAFRARDHRNGIRDTTTDRDNTATDLAGRIKLRWLVTDTLTADLGYLESASRQEGVGFVLEKATPRSLERFRRFDPETVADPYAGVQALDVDQFSDRDTDSLSGKLTQKIGDFAFVRDMELVMVADQATSKAPYRFDADFSPIPLTSLSSQGPERYRQRSLELRTTLNTPMLFGLGESVDWVIGAFAIRTNASVTQLSNLNRNAILDFVLAGGGPAGQIPALPAELTSRMSALGLPTDIASLPAIPSLFPGSEDREYTTNILRTHSQSYAGFFQATGHLTSDLSLVLGLRVGSETGSGEQSSNCVPNGGPPCFGAPVFAKQHDFTSSGTRDESEFSPKFAVSYSLTEGISLFGNVTRGFKSGGFSGPLLAPNHLQYKPERALSTELGVKTRLFNGSLTFDAAVYRVKFDNLQVQIFDGINITTVNAATATSQGVEADFQWLPPLRFLTVAGSFGMEDVSYDSFPCGPATAGSTGTAPECNPDGAPNPPPTQDLTGRQTAFTPKFTGSLTPSARFPLWPRHNIGALVGVDVIYQGAQYLDVDLDPEKFQAATIKLNARLAVKSLGGPWALIFNAKNLTGARERVLVLNQNQIVGNYIAIPYPDEPAYSLDLRYSFGS